VTANQHIYAKLNYDPEKDFVPSPTSCPGRRCWWCCRLSVRVSQGAGRRGEGEPRQADLRACRIGSQTHLAAENFLYQAKADAVSVPYKGEGPALAGLVGGETTFALTNLAARSACQRGPAARPGITSRTEAPQLPGVPPIASTLPGFENAGWFGIVAPAGTPKEIIAKVYQDTKKALDTTNESALLRAGLAPVGNSPEEFATAMKAETALWSNVVKERNIHVQ